MKSKILKSFYNCKNTIVVILMARTRERHSVICEDMQFMLS